MCSAHFCVHYVRKTRDAPSLQDADGDGFPNYVEQVSTQAEKSYRVEVGQMGWKRPRADDGRGGSNKTDIYLSQIGEGFYGYAATDPGQTTSRFPRRRSRYTYMVIDNNFSRAEFGAPPEGTAAVTIAHEFNHVLQFTYDVLQDAWMDESTATWMENEVFPNVDDYFNYVRGWARESRVPLTSAGFPKLYGSAVWLQWLAERHGARVVRQAWQRAQKIKPAGFSVRVFNSAIKRTSRSNFARSFARFAANTAEWRVNRRFPEGFSFPRVRRAGHLVPGRTVKRRLHHTGYQLLRVPVPDDNPRVLRLAAWLEPDTRAAVALVALGAGGREAEDGDPAEVPQERRQAGGDAGAAQPLPADHRGARQRGCAAGRLRDLRLALHPRPRPGPRPRRLPALERLLEDRHVLPLALESAVPLVRSDDPPAA